MNLSEDDIFELKFRIGMLEHIGHVLVEVPYYDGAGKLRTFGISSEWLLATARFLNRLIIDET
jgi:hypothetical protein